LQIIIPKLIKWDLPPLSRMIRLFYGRWRVILKLLRNTVSIAVMEISVKLRLPGPIDSFAQNLMMGLNKTRLIPQDTWPYLKMNTSGNYDSSNVRNVDIRKTLTLYSLIVAEMKSYVILYSSVRAQFDYYAIPRDCHLPKNYLLITINGRVISSRSPETAYVCTCIINVLKCGYIRS